MNETIASNSSWYMPGSGPLLLLLWLVGVIVSVFLGIFWIWFPITTWQQLKQLNRQMEETNKRLAALQPNAAGRDPNNPFK